MKRTRMATLLLLLNSSLDLVPTVSLHQHPKMMLPLKLKLALFGMPPLHHLVPGLLNHPIYIGLLMEQLKKMHQSLTGDALQMLQLLVQIQQNHGTKITRQHGLMVHQKHPLKALGQLLVATTQFLVAEKWMINLRLVINSLTGSVLPHPSHLRMVKMPLCKDTVPLVPKPTPSLPLQVPSPWPSPLASLPPLPSLSEKSGWAKKD